MQLHACIEACAGAEPLPSLYPTVALLGPRLPERERRDVTASNRWLMIIVDKRGKMSACVTQFVCSWIGWSRVACMALIGLAFVGYWLKSKQLTVLDVLVDPAGEGARCQATP